MPLIANKVIVGDIPKKVEEVPPPKPVNNFELHLKKVAEENKKSETVINTLEELPQYVEVIEGDLKKLLNRKSDYLRDMAEL